MATSLWLTTGCEKSGGDDDPSVNVTGKWLIEGLQFKVTANLIQTGDTVTGTLTESGDTIPLTSGSVDGDKITLMVVVGDMNFTWEGVVTDPTMTGTVTLIDGADTYSGPFTGRRI